MTTRLPKEVGVLLGCRSVWCYFGKSEKDSRPSGTVIVGSSVQLRHCKDTLANY